MSNSAKNNVGKRTRALVPTDQCGMAQAIEILGDKWTLYLLREAFYGVTRFDDMREDLKAPRAILSQRLTQMVNDGILERCPYREPGARTRDAYVLTAAGRELALVVIAIMQWGDRHLLEDVNPLKIVDKKTGKPVTISLVSETGRPVPLDRIKAIVREQTK